MQSRNKRTSTPTRLSVRGMASTQSRNSVWKRQAFSSVHLLIVQHVPCVCLWLSVWIVGTSFALPSMKSDVPSRSVKSSWLEIQRCTSTKLWGKGAKELGILNFGKLSEASVEISTHVVC